MEKARERNILGTMGKEPKKDFAHLSCNEECL